MTHYDEAIAIFDSPGLRHVMPALLDDRAHACLQLGALGDAERSLRETVQRYAEYEGGGYVKAGAILLARVRAALGRAEGALEALERDRTESREGDLRLHLAHTPVQLAFVLEALGRHAEAELRAREAVTLQARVWPIECLDAYGTLARAILAQGRAAEALAIAREGLEYEASFPAVPSLDVELPVVEADALGALGERFAARFAAQRAAKRVTERADRIGLARYRETFLALPACRRALALAAERDVS